MADEVLYEVEERIAFITLNRPQARNAVNGAVATAMNDIMHRFESDPEVWVAISPALEPGLLGWRRFEGMASGEGDSLKRRRRLWRLRTLPTDQAGDRCG